MQLNAEGFFYPKSTAPSNRGSTYKVPLNFIAMVNSGVSNSVAHDPNATAARDHGVQSHEPASEVAHEHTHSRGDEAGYSKGITLGKAAASDQELQPHDLHRRHLPEDSKVQPGISDPEKADLAHGLTEEADSRSGSFSKFYAKYRIVFHLGIWLFFTG